MPAPSFAGAGHHSSPALTETEKEMLRLPSSYQGTNIHRAVLTHETLPGTDYDRLEDLVADAIAAARRAVQVLDSFNEALPRPIMRRVAYLKHCVKHRSVLNDFFRACAATVLERCDSMEALEAEADARDQARYQLRKAIELSHRVCDLLAADRELARRRDERR